MIIMYEPCNDCNHKQCERCAYTALKINYNRALKRIIELSPEPITLIHCPQETKLYEIWMESDYDYGRRCPVRCLGSAEGHSFKDACKRFARKCAGFGQYFDEQNMTYWGCRLFDNEFDAKKSRG